MKAFFVCNFISYDARGGIIILKLLEDRIRQDGVVLPGNVLKVNQFLNHQIDPQLMYEIGQNLRGYLKNVPSPKF